MKEHVELVITGSVQGVGFRYFVKGHAERLGITGFVKNMESGAVEVVAEGEETALIELIELCRNGPSHAGVKDCVVEYDDPTGKFSEFSIM